MYKTLRKESLIRVLPRIIVCAVLAVAFLAVSGSGLLRLLMGPQSLSELTEEELDGKYVSFDASEIIVAFANLTVSNSEGDTETLKTYYLLPFGDETYMAVMDAKEQNVNVIDRAMEQSHEYYLGDLETLIPLGDVSGTITELEDGMLDYMAECVDNYELPGYEEGSDSTNLMVSYQVNLDYVGFLKKPVVLVLGGFGLLFLLLAVVQLVVVLTGCYQKKLRHTLVGATEEDFQEAVTIERIRVGKYIWFSKGPGSRGLVTADLIWGYAMPEPMVVSKYRWPVALYDREQKMTRINFMDQKNCQKFLEAIAAQGNPFVMGYSSEHAQKFQDDFQGFVQEAARQS